MSDQNERDQEPIERELTEQELSEASGGAPRGTPTGKPGDREHVGFGDDERRESGPRSVRSSQIKPG